MMPEEQIFWQLQKRSMPQRITGSIKADVVIVGGGMSGLSAAQKFRKAGHEVIVLERYFCGGGASGKSSGFITQNAELGLTHYVDVYGPTKARAIWEFVTSGVAAIRENIEKYDIDCDYVKEDTLIVANSLGGMKELTLEYENLIKLNYPSYLYDKQTLENLLHADSFYGAMRYENTFGINVYSYLQAMKDILVHEGVKIYEETPVLAVHDHGVETPDAKITADHIVMCIDRFMPELGLLTDKVYQAETFILLSAPLTDAEVQSIFPSQRFMMWDTDMVYQYYRITGDNRFLIGGSTMMRTFHFQTPYTPNSVYKKLTNYVKTRFPQLALNFEYMWPGLIGVSKDMQPIIGPDAASPHIYYVTGATGLPWAAALGTYAADAIVEKRHDFDELFSPTRSFYFDGCMQKIMGKPSAFALANLISLKQ